MDVHIFIDSESYLECSIEDMVEPVRADLRLWVDNKSSVSLLDQCSSDSAEEWKLGIGMKVKSKFKLKGPLNFLYELSQKYQCEFVVAEYDEESGTVEAVCYFGYEEGRPDLFEIANYLGL